ncbi:MAG: response regulator [Aphanothece sp. CMT-3BRIN-NPC111]|jgi:twitching motility two-component system response regulator PilG|nr:response regulator [Aphanothece sp. CMT-3BRIN-NPC111]
MDSHGTFQYLSPLALLDQLYTSQANGYLQVLSGQVSWSIYFENGKITYASHSVEPFERLERHLRRLGYKMTDFLKDAFAQVQLSINGNTEQSLKNVDYSTVCALIGKQHLNNFQAAELIEELAKEVIETFSWVKEGSYKFFDVQIGQPLLARLDVKSLIEYCQKRLLSWQSLLPEIWSPYQRPYFFGRNQNQPKSLLSEENKFNSLLEQRLGTLLKGFSFRQLAVLLKQDEIKLAQSLRQYIVDGTIMLREPQSPFEQLPKIPEVNLERFSKISTSARAETTTNIAISLASPQPTLVYPPPVDNHKKYTVVCVDDSPTILNEIIRFLDDKSFSVSAISEPLKALMQIVRLKPDIILLDVGMPNINGYELCRLIRNNSLFKTTPIIMVTGNTGLIDRAKAKLVGASGYLTKPFNQSELLKMVFKHIS